MTSEVILQIVKIHRKFKINEGVKEIPGIPKSKNVEELMFLLM